MIDAEGALVGRMAVEDFRTGNMRSGQWSKIRHNSQFYENRLRLIVSKIPNLGERLGSHIKENNIMLRMVIPLAVLFETWNMSRTIETLTDIRASLSLTKSKFKLYFT